MIWLLIAVLTAVIALFAKLYWTAGRALKSYGPLVDLDDEIKKREKAVEDLENKLRTLHDEEVRAEADIQKKRIDHEHDKKRMAVEAESNRRDLEQSLRNLKEELKLFNDDRDLLAAGFYRPKYDFVDSQAYAARLDRIRDSQKELIKAKTAIVCDTEWTVSGSKAEGKKMTDRVIRLGLSAFNVQCDNEILSVRFDNIDRSEAKLKKIRETVDKQLEPNMCRITNEFFKLKIEELFLAYEYAEKVQKEKEEQRQIREQMREEERARREAEKAEAEAEREEKKYAEALEKARAEILKKSEADQAAYAEKISALEQQLRDAHEKKERAKSLAEQTRRGHVYVISNVGSFGEDVYKIGMTRRLDPMDRIWELSDASVPFDFDVHAIIPSDDAPALERMLHEHFDGRRLNKVNQRKEFFRVTIEEIAERCMKIYKREFKLTLLAEAKEYRQSAAESATKDKEAA